MADLVFSKIKLPLTPIRHENRDKFLLYTYFWVISCTHPACSQHFNKIHPEKRPSAIHTFTGYQKSISHNPNKRMVLLQKYVTPLYTDFKYASTDNFTKKVLYKNPVATVREPVAIALRSVQETLKSEGLSLKFFDAYRPWSVTRQMWEIVPDERYAANPAKGSGHNRGIAVDVTLVKSNTGEELQMPTPFDDFTEKAHQSYMQLSPEILNNRSKLKTIMEKHGFTALGTEWWHFSFSDTTEKFELIDIDFKVMSQILKDAD